MNAVEFVKKFGWGEFKDLYQASLYVDPFQPTSEKIIGIKKSEIKELFDAFELVEKYKNRHGGIRFRIRWGMFRYGDTQEFNDRLKQALNLVEQCQ